MSNPLPANGTKDRLIDIGLTLAAALAGVAGKKAAEWMDKKLSARKKKKRSKRDGTKHGTNETTKAGRLPSGSREVDAGAREAQEV